MSVVAIYAVIECDECGLQFRASLDPARKLPAAWTLWDEAEEVVRGGIDHYAPGISTSVQDGKMLCSACTKEVDEQEPEP